MKSVYIGNFLLKINKQKITARKRIVISVIDCKTQLCYLLINEFESLRCLLIFSNYYTDSSFNFHDFSSTPMSFDFFIFFLSHNVANLSVV